MYYNRRRYRPRHPVKDALYNARVTIEWALEDFYKALFTKAFWENVGMWLLFSVGLLIFEILFLLAMQGK